MSDNPDQPQDAGVSLSVLQNPAPDEPRLEANTVYDLPNVGFTPICTNNCGATLSPQTVRDNQAEGRLPQDYMCDNCARANGQRLVHTTDQGATQNLYNG